MSNNTGRVHSNLMCLYNVQSEQGVYTITNTMQLVASKWTERARGLADTWSGLRGAEQVACPVGYPD